MKKFKYIKESSPIRWPIFQTITTWLLLDRFHASDLVIGIVATLLGIVWVACIAYSWNQEGIELFNEDKTKIKKEFL